MRGATPVSPLPDRRGTFSRTPLSHPWIRRIPEDLDIVIQQDRENTRMNWRVRAIQSIAAVGLGLAMAAASGIALAKQMVSVKGSTVNMRAGPSTGSEVLWELERGYPLEVLRRQGNWVEVRDFEDDRGWVARTLVSNSAHFIVKAGTANVRSGPGTRYRIIGKAQYGELLRTLERQQQWVRVRRAGGEIGWIARKLLWGW